MKCPDCVYVPLQAIKIPGKPEVDFCNRCEGSFYDEGELSVDVSIISEKDTNKECPRCEGSYLVSGPIERNAPVIEKCKKCNGTWLSGGMIDKLRDYYDQEDVLSKEYNFVEYVKSNNLGKIKYNCPKCHNKSYEISEVRTQGGSLSGLFDVNSRKFSSISCKNCTYTEFYKKDVSLLYKVFDFYVGN